MRYSLPPLPLREAALLLKSKIRLTRIPGGSMMKSEGDGCLWIRKWLVNSNYHTLSLGLTLFCVM